MACAVVMAVGSFSRPELDKFVIIAATPEFACVQLTVPFVVELTT
jgi:hypothetical protein